MKTIFKFFVPAALAALAMVSCAKEIDTQVVPEEGNAITITVKAFADDIKAEGETKTYLGTYNAVENTVLWGTGEYMKLAVTSEGGGTVFATSTDASADIFDGEPSALFEFSVTPETAASYTYQGIYPASAAVASSNTTPASYKVSLPATQNATADSYDPAAYIMVAEPTVFNSVETDWAASFRRATALNKVTLKNLPGGISVKRVKFTVPDGKYLAGARHIDLTTGLSGDIYNGGGRTETVDVKFASPIASGSNIDVWFTSWGVTVEEGEALTVVVYTTDKKSYTRTVTVPSGRTISFQEGYLNTVGINMSGIDPEDVTELEEGNYVILAKDGDNYYAVTASLSGNHIASTDYTGSTSSYNGDADYIWTVTKSGSSYIFENEGKYIGYKGSSNEAYWLEAGESWTESNYLLDVVWDGANSCYNVTLNSNSNRKFSRNGSYDYFAFYTSDQQKNIIFVPATVDTRTVVTLSFAEDAISKTTANYDEFTGQTATASPVETDITDNITYALSGDAIGTVNASTGVVSLNGDTGTATITASFAGDANYRAAEASYTIVVSSASSPQYELVTAANEVVEGDYIITWNNTYYLPSGSTSGTNPAVGTGITVAGDKITNTVTSDMVWTFTGDNTNGFTISDGTNILHSTNAAQGISITTDSERKWTVSVDGTYGMLLHGDDGGSRYLAVYNSVTWRYYATGGNYSGKLRLYKYVAAPDNRDEAPISWSAATGTATWSSSGISSTLPSLTNTGSLAVSYSSSAPAVATVANDGTVTILSGGSTNISATYDGSDPSAPYKTTTVSYALTVTDSRTACATPSFSPAAGEVVANTTVTISCATEGATIHYTVDGSTPTTESATYSSAITIDAAKTIKAIAVKTNYLNSEVATADYVLTVATVGSGTEADPYTAGDILDKYPTGSGDANVYVTGTITAITEVNTSYHNATYTISDGARSILVYRGKYIDNADFTSADQIAVNDIVVVYGKIGTYNSTPQLATGNYLISVTKDTTTPTLSVDPTSLSWAADETDTKNLTVTLNGSAAAGDYTYNVTSGTAGNWTITKNNGTLYVAPNAENNDTENAKSITIRIAHASDNAVYQDVTCTQAKASSGNTPNPVDKEYSFAFTTIVTTGWSNSYADHTVYDDSVVTITLKSSSKQTSNVTAVPVTKAGDAIVILKDGTMSAVTFTLTQWTTKAKTVSLQYSTDGGSSFSDLNPAVSSSNFTLSSSSLPTGTNAIKMVQGNTSNQVGINGVEFTYTPSN